MWNVLWVNEEDSNGSWSDVVYTSELNLQWPSPSRRYGHEQPLNIVAFQLSPHRRVASSLRCLSRGIPRYYVYKDRRLYHLFGDDDDAGSAVVDSYDLDLGNMQRVILRNQGIDTIHFVPYHDLSISQAYLLGLRGSDGPAWYHRYQLLHSNDSLHCLWLNAKTQRLERYQVALPSASFWSGRIAALKRKDSKYTNLPAATQWWSHAKPSIICHSNRYVYLLLYFPLLGHVELARLPIPHGELGGWSTLPLEVLPLVVSTDIAPTTTYGFTPFQFDSSATMPSISVLHKAFHHTAVTEDADDIVLREADLTYHLRSMRPWRVLDAHRLQLPILMPSAAASSSHPSEISCVFLEFQWQPLHLERHRSRGHLYHRDLLQHFGFLSEILDNVFAIAMHVSVPSMACSPFSEASESSGANDAIEATLASSSPVKSAAGKPEKDSLVDHLAHYRHQRASCDDKVSSPMGATLPAPLVHPGEGLLSLMRQAGQLELRVVAQQAYIRPPRRGGGSEGAAVSVWEAAKSWVPVQYDWFIHVPAVTAVMSPAVVDVLDAIVDYVQSSRLFTAPGVLSSTSAPLTDDANSPWSYAIRSDGTGRAMDSSTRRSQATSSLWAHSWIDTLPLPTLCPAATTPSTVSHATMATIAPEVMLLMVSACHRYPARRLFYPALWTTELLQRLTLHPTTMTRTTSLSARRQRRSDEPTSTDQRYQQVVHPVVSVFAYLLYHRRPSEQMAATAPTTATGAELETYERCHHSPETLYEVMTLTLQAQQSLLVHDLAIIREEEAAGRRAAYPMEQRGIPDTAVGRATMPSGLAPSAVTETVPLHQLEWSQWWSLLAQPHVVPLSPTPNLSAAGRHETQLAHGSQLQQSPQDSDRSDDEADAVEEETSATSSSTVSDNDADSRDHHSDEDDADEPSVHRVHREDGHHLRHLLHHAILTAFHAHFAAVAASSSSLPQAQDASYRLEVSQRAVLQRLLLHCHYPQSTYWSDFAHVLHVDGQHATLYRWALRTCFASNAYDELRLRRDEDFDPALCGAWVRFVTIPAETSVFWRRYASLVGLTDGVQWPPVVIADGDGRSDGDRVVRVVHTALEAPPTAAQIFLLTLRMLFVRLYDAQDTDDTVVIEERIVTLLRVCPRVLIAGLSHHRHPRTSAVTTDEQQHLWQVVRQCLPMASLLVTETRASHWQRRVLEIEQTIYDEEHVDYLLTCSV
eukprot:gene1942-1406_t